MKTLVLNGERGPGDGTAVVEAALMRERAGSGDAIERVLLREERIGPCRGCFCCWTKTPGLCVIDDAAGPIGEALVNSDLAVLLTPVTFGGYSSELKKLLDRLIPLISPMFMKVHGVTRHRPRYPRYPGLLGLRVGAADAEEGWIFGNLVECNALNLHAPAHAAWVFSRGEGEEILRKKIAALIDRVKGASHDAEEKRPAADRKPQAGTEHLGDSG